MPRYHFDVHDGVGRPDREGTDLPGWRFARLEAIRLAGAILRDEAARIAPGEDRRIEVADGTGLVPFQMAFVIVESPVLRRDPAVGR